MVDLLNQDYVRRLQVLRQRIERSLRGLEIHRVSSDGPVILPEPESHRPYSPGDNPGYIDWNLYARTDRFFVKSMLREQEGTLTVLLDVSSSMFSPFPGKAKAAREIAGAVSYLSLCAGNQVQLTPWSSRIEPIERTFTGEKSAPGLLRSLSSLQAEPEGVLTDLSRSLGQILTIPDTGNSWILIISDFMDMTPYQGLVKALSVKSTRFGAIQVLHPEEIHPTVRGNLMLVDTETGRERNRVIGHRSLRQMRKIVKTFKEETRKDFTDNGGSFNLVSCQDPFEKTVLRFLSAIGAMTA